MGFNKIISKIKKGNYDVSIVKALFDGINNIEYGVFNSNSICIYTHDDKIIKEIEKIAQSMKYRTAFRRTNKFAPNEIFIY